MKPSDVKNHHRISAIIPVYNAEKYLERCVSSVLSQTFTEFELILVNDGSTDGSGKICDKLAQRDERIKVIHQNNAGVSMARNKGIETATGEWLCFYDADDTIPFSAFEKLMENAQWADVDVIIGSYEEIDQKGVASPRTNNLPKNRIISGNEIKDIILKGALTPNNFFSACWLKFFKRDFFILNNLTFPIRRRAEDWLLNVQVFERAKSVLIINDKVYNYHRHDGSAMSQCFPEQLQIWKENLQIKNRLINDYNFNISSAWLNTHFMEQVLWHCLQIIYIRKNTKNEIIGILKDPVIVNSSKNINLSHLPTKLRLAAMFLRQQSYNMVYIYLKIFQYANLVKRRIAS